MSVVCPSTAGEGVSAGADPAERHAVQHRRHHGRGEDVGIDLTVHDATDDHLGGEFLTRVANQTPTGPERLPTLTTGKMRREALTPDIRVTTHPAHTRPAQAEQPTDQTLQRPRRRRVAGVLVVPPPLILLTPVHQLRRHINQQLVQNVERRSQTRLRRQPREQLKKAHPDRRSLRQPLKQKSRIDPEQLQRDDQLEQQQGRDRHHRDDHIIEQRRELIHHLRHRAHIIRRRPQRRRHILRRLDECLFSLAHHTRTNRPHTIKKLETRLIQKIRNLVQLLRQSIKPLRLQTRKLLTIKPLEELRQILRTLKSGHRLNTPTPEKRGRRHPAMTRPHLGQMQLSRSTRRISGGNPSGGPPPVLSSVPGATAPSGDLLRNMAPTRWLA